MAEDITNNKSDSISEEVSSAASPVEAKTEQTATVAAHTPQGWKWCALAGLALTVLAWVTMVYGLVASACLGIAGLLTSIAACWMSGRTVWRDLAITCIIASGVLLLVYALFVFGIDIALNMI